MGHQSFQGPEEIYGSYPEKKLMSEYVHVCTHIFVYNFGREDHRLPKAQVHGPKVKHPFHR